MSAMKLIATFIAKNALFLVVGMLVSYAGLSPFEHWQWWAWFSAVMAFVLLRDLAIHLEAK